MARYHPLSYEINTDPEVWELTDKFGDRALRVWLEILRMADANRNNPAMKGTLEGIAKSLLWVYSRGNPRWQKTDLERLQSLLRWASEKGWIALRSVSETFQNPLLPASEVSLTVCKYSKYHKTRSENSPPTNLTLTNLTNRDTLSSAPPPDPESINAKELGESWNQWFNGKLPAVVLPLSKSRQQKAAARVKEHGRVDFWEQVFTQIERSKFLMGSSNGNWRCTFDFVIANDTNCIKIWEGNYGDNKKAGR